MLRLALAVMVVFTLGQMINGDTANADRKMKLCCAKLDKADPHCKQNYCAFSALSQTNILGFLATCVSKGPTVGQMWDCASSRIDHSDCCKAKGITGTCLEYCAAHDGVPTNYLNYLFCLSAFDRVRDCFTSYLDTHPNLNGEN